MTPSRTPITPVPARRSLRTSGVTPATPVAKRTAALFGRTGTAAATAGAAVTVEAFPVGIVEHTIGEAFDGIAALELRYDPVGQGYASCVVVLRQVADADEWRFGWRTFTQGRAAIEDWQAEVARLNEDGFSLP